jgi:hypothetical protein
MDLGSPVSTLTVDDEGGPIYSRKDLDKTALGWDNFTLIIDVEKKDMCYNCLRCLPAGKPILKATHIHSGKGKGQKGVFTLKLASSGVKKHLQSQHPDINLSVDEGESKGESKGRWSVGARTDSYPLRPNPQMNRQHFLRKAPPKS